MNVFSQFNRFLFDIKIKIYFYISGLFYQCSVQHMNIYFNDLCLKFCHLLLTKVYCPRGQYYVFRTCGGQDIQRGS